MKGGVDGSMFVFLVKLLEGIFPNNSRRMMETSRLRGYTRNRLSHGPRGTRQGETTHIIRGVVSIIYDLCKKKAERPVCREVVFAISICIGKTVSCISVIVGMH